MTLQWIRDVKEENDGKEKKDAKITEMRCQLLFDGTMAFELDPQKSYRLAVAMLEPAMAISRSFRITWKSFAKYEDVLTECK